MSTELLNRIEQQAVEIAELKSRLAAAETRLQSLLADGRRDLLRGLVVYGNYEDILEHRMYRLSNELLDKLTECELDPEPGSKEGGTHGQ